MNPPQNYNNNTELMTIYIPRMSLSTTEKEVVEIFYNRGFGEVRRVDFISIYERPGFAQSNYIDTMKSGFVHFNKFYNDKKGLLENLEKCEKKCILYLDAEKRAYWILLKAKTVIPDTMMNNHQIVENCRYLEKKIENQENTIKKYEERIQNLEKHIAYFMDEPEDREVKMIKNFTPLRISHAQWCKNKHDVPRPNYDYSYDIVDDEDSLSLDTNKDLLY